MQQQDNTFSTCLVPSPRNPKVLVTQEAAKKIREEMLNSSAASAKVQAPALSASKSPQKQEYVAPPPKTGQSAKPKFIAPPVFQRQGSIPPLLAQAADTSSHQEQTRAPPEAQPRHEAVAPTPAAREAARIHTPVTGARGGAPEQEKKGPVPAKPNTPALPVPAAQGRQSPKTKKATPINQKTGTRQPGNTQPSKGAVDEGSVAIVPPAREDNIPDELGAAPPIQVDEDLFDLLDA